MTEDRKGQGLLLGMSCAENITITDLRKISRHGILERDAERSAATRLVDDLRIKTPSIDQTGAQLLRRQPAEGRHRQMAVPRLKSADLRRTDARHRRRREGGNL